MFCNFYHLCVVNYFAHYFFDQQPQNVHYNFGLLAPDLLRNYSKNQYSKSAIHQSCLRDDEFSKGMCQHLKRDQYFHDSEFFHCVYNEIHSDAQKAFQASAIPRFWFGTHVMIEMILDSVLIELHSDILHQMYLDIEASMYNISTHLKIVAHQNQQQFTSGMDSFLQSRFLFKYKSDGLIYGLNRVYRQVGADTEDWQKSAPLIQLSDSIKKLILLNLNKLNI